MNRKTATAYCLIIAATLFSSTVFAIEPTPIEKENMVTIDAQTASALAWAVKEMGYDCSSISAASRFLLSEGFTLLCNGYRYKYELANNGGKWSITVK